jgi:RNA polymerase sigma-70 factor (ECF subfamily)
MNRSIAHGAPPIPARGNGGVPPPPNAVSSLEALLARALHERDERALDEAIRRMRPAMQRVAVNHGSSPDDTEDLIQETWLAGLAGVRRFQGRALLSTWLLRILSYRARTLHRRATRSVPMSWLAAAGDEWEADAEPAFGRGTSRPDEAVAVRELEESIAEAMSSLPSRQREVFSLRDVEGESAEQVCRTLGVSPANQRVLLHRARSQVRRRLSGHWGRARRTPGTDADAHGWLPVRRAWSPHILEPNRWSIRWNRTWRPSIACAFHPSAGAVA